MRGFFGLGVDRISKPMNVGNLFRTAHAFGAHFLFSVAPAFPRHPEADTIMEGLEQEIGLVTRALNRADTSSATDQVPYYAFPDPDSLLLPQGCRLVGVELTEDAIDLPSFRHPLKAAYILGPERGNLAPELVERCDFVVKIPTAFCVNVGIAGAIVLYDRQICLGRFAERPVRPGGPVEPLPAHVHGGPVLRSYSQGKQGGSPKEGN